MSDFYADLDLLADVFEDTEHAPLPEPYAHDFDGTVLRYQASRLDPRWQYDRYDLVRPSTR